MTILNANEYITKGDVMQILQKAYTDGRIQAKDGCASVLDDIAAIKADVQPVKRGEWEKKSSVGVFRCSLCQHIFMLGADEIDEYHFCPNCGADMRGAENG